MFDCALHVGSMMVLVDSNSPREANESDGKVVRNRESCCRELCLLMAQSV